VVVIAGEALDRVQRVPEREHQELRVVADVAPQHPDAGVALRGGVLREAGLVQVAAVRVAVAPPHGALPDARDHGCSFRRAPTRPGNLEGPGATGLEPATSGVTGRRSNQLNYAPERREIVAAVPGPGRAPGWSAEVPGESRRVDRGGRGAA